MRTLRKFLTTSENMVSRIYVHLLDTLKSAPGFSKADLRNSGLGNVWEVSDLFTVQHCFIVFHIAVFRCASLVNISTFILSNLESPNHVVASLYSITLEGSNTGREGRQYYSLGRMGWALGPMCACAERTTNVQLSSFYTFPFLLVCLECPGLLKGNIPVLCGKQLWLQFYVVGLVPNSLRQH